MKIETKCPECGHCFKVDDDYLTRRGRCASCKAVFVITEHVESAKMDDPLPDTAWKPFDRAILNDPTVLRNIRVAIGTIVGLCMVAVMVVQGIKGWNTIQKAFDDDPSLGDWLGSVAFVFGAIVIVGLMYLLPLFVAILRGHINWPAIAILNVLLGWTGIGWVVALVWSFTAMTTTITLNHRHED